MHLRCIQFTTVLFPQFPRLCLWTSCVTFSSCVTHLQLHRLLKIHLREKEKPRILYVLVTAVKRPPDSKTFCWLTVCPALLFLQDSLFSFKHCYYSFTHSVQYVLMLQTENSNFHPFTVSLRETLMNWSGTFVDLRSGVKTLKGTSAGRNTLIDCSLMHNLKSLLLIQQHVQTGPGFTKITDYPVI